jgi:DNA-binding HxlR family transcriptional regulator
MDYFDQRILFALRDGKPHSFTALQSQVSFSHNTLQQHLTRLVEKGLVLKGKDPAKSFGRPRYAYHILSKTTKQVVAALEDPGVELVTLPFSRVRHICRFEKGGWCKKRKVSCSPQICPQIRK